MPKMSFSFSCIELEKIYSTWGRGEWGWRGEGDREGLRGLKIEGDSVEKIGRVAVEKIGSASFPLCWKA